MKNFFDISIKISSKSLLLFSLGFLKIYVKPFSESTQFFFLNFLGTTSTFFWNNLQISLNKK